jgi:pre-mRNA-processing factor 6
MSFRGGRSGGKSAAPRNYVPGVGRGAAGFTTRSDVGPAAAPGGGGGGGESTGGSRAADARAARLSQKPSGAAASASSQQPTGIFGAAPQNYVPGAGRGAGRGAGGPAGGAPGGGPGGDNNNNNNARSSAGAGPVGAYDAFGGYTEQRPEQEGQYDEDDDEADKIWAAVDERMNSKRKRKTDEEQQAAKTEEDQKNARARIGAQFRELKEKLSGVTEDQWASIPEVGDYSIKYKQQKQKDQDVFTPLTDSLLEQRSQANMDTTAGNAAISATTTAVDSRTSSGLQSTVVSNMSGLGAARGTVLGMSLDKMSDSVTGQTVVDPAGYLTSMSTVKSGVTADVGDINKARLLLKSVRDTNPKHGPGWIASARVEEAAGKILQARKIIQEGCHVCPDNEDVWLEAARLHPQEVGKSILATAVRRIPHSVKIFLKAADLEHAEASKKAVLRKALEANPASVTLWKAAIELEEAEDAAVLLAVAVEKIPHSVEMWLALARLETYANAQKVLNKARKALPADRTIWLAAAKLEESQNHNAIVEKVVDRAVKSLAKHESIVSRDQWLQEAEACEASGAPVTSAAIVKCTIGMDVDFEDRQRTWAGDAKACLSRGSVATARAILSHSLAVFPNKRSLWMQAVDLEKKYGTASTLDEVLAAASERLPRIEIFWLLRAKERWLAKDIDKSREILTQAFAANPDSEAVWLAAAKLEWETGETERARVLLQRARERAPTDRVSMKSAVLEREHSCFDAALKLIEDGIAKYPKSPKLYMMGGQICSDDLSKQKSSLDKARNFYQRGLQECPNNTVLWKLASLLEERAATFEPNKTATAAVSSSKARSLLELARLKNPKNPELWQEAVRLERRSGNPKLAVTLMAKALQECPKSGLLLAENISSAPRVERKSKAADAIKRCPDNAHVIAAVASHFASERKTEKARKWFDRAVILDPDLGDSWAKFYAFELESGTKEQQQAVKDRCVAAEPHHGEVWASVTKNISNRGKSVAEGLELTSQEIRNSSTTTVPAPATNTNGNGAKPK